MRPYVFHTANTLYHLFSFLSIPFSKKIFLPSLFAPFLLTRGEKCDMIYRLVWYIVCPISWIYSHSVGAKFKINSWYDDLLHRRIISVEDTLTRCLQASLTHLRGVCEADSWNKFHEPLRNRTAYIWCSEPHHIYAGISKRSQRGGLENLSVKRSTKPRKPLKTLTISGLRKMQKLAYLT